MSTASRVRQHLREFHRHGRVLSKEEHLERMALQRTGSMPDLFSVPVGMVIGQKAVVEQGRGRRVLMGVEKAQERHERTVKFSNRKERGDE